jgi:hypothetical protein
MKTLDIIIYADKSIEVLEDLSNPTLHEISLIRKRVMVWLDMEQYNAYIACKIWAEREAYIDKILKLI